MRVLFIYTVDKIGLSKKPLFSYDQIQFGISYISSLLKEHGHETKLIVFSRGSKRIKEKIVDAHILKFNPQLVCFTAVSTQYPPIASIAKYIKNKYPNIYLLIGGPHASLNPNIVIKDDFDALCIGEGEYPTLDLVNQLGRGEIPSEIQNLWLKKESKVEENPIRPFIEKIDMFPHPDRLMWDEWIDPEPESQLSVLLSRGCPYLCTYCCNHAFKKLAGGKYVRFRSPDLIADEIKELAVRYPEQNEFFLEAESFSVDIDWGIEVCSRLEEVNKEINKALSYGVNIRITRNSDLERLFSALKKCNTRYINIGLESGSERLRYNILKRFYSNEDLIKTVNIARKYGLKVATYNMIGMPGETIKDHQETIELNRIIQPEWHNTSIFFPYPGTELFTMSKELGLLNEKLDINMERIRATLDLPGFSKKQIQTSYEWFNYKVYKDHKSKGLLVLKVILTKMRSKYFLEYLRFTSSRLWVFKWLRRKLTWERFNKDAQ